MLSVACPSYGKFCATNRCRPHRGAVVHVVLTAGQELTGDWEASEDLAEIAEMSESDI